LGVAGELSVSLLNRDSCNEASFSPNGMHKSAQGCGPAATLGEPYSLTGLDNPNFLKITYHRSSLLIKP